MLVLSGFRIHRIIDKHWREINLKNDCSDCCNKKMTIVSRIKVYGWLTPFGYCYLSEVQFVTLE